MDCNIPGSPTPASALYAASAAFSAAFCSAIRATVALEIPAFPIAPPILPHGRIAAKSSAFCPAIPGSTDPNPSSLAFFIHSASWFLFVDAK